MNDPDDGVLAEYSLDILRYLSSLKLLDSFKFSTKETESIFNEGMKRYLHGLKGEKASYSKHTRKLLEKAKSKNMDDHDDWLKDKVEDLRLKRESRLSMLTI